MADKSDIDQYLIIKINYNDSVILKASNGKKSGTRYYSGLRVIIPLDSTLRVKIIPAIKLNKESFMFTCDTTILLSAKTNGKKYIAYKKTKFGKHGKALMINLKKVHHCRPAFISANKLAGKRIKKITDGNEYLIGEYNYKLNRIVYFNKLLN